MPATLQKTSTRSLFPLSPTLVTIPIVLVKSVLGGVSSRGEACYPYLADAGIAPELLDQPAARVTADQYAALMRSLMERLGDEALGFLSRRLKHGTFLLMGRAALGAPDLEHAIRRVCKRRRQPGPIWSRPPMRALCPARRCNAG